MKPKVAKVYRVTARNKATRNHPARVTSERKATNFELMRDRLQQCGYIRLRTVVQIQLAGGSYAGARGYSLRFMAYSVKDAEEFLSDLQETASQIAETDGLKFLKAKEKKKEGVTA